VAHPQIAAFPRLAEANAKPTRAIAGQNTLITRTIHDMAYDPVRDEIVVPQFYAQAIMTFRGGANGNEAPVRIIRGPDTQLANPARIGADFVHNEIYVPLDNRLLVFPRDAQGNVAPIRIIEGPDTQMDAGAVAVDPVRGLVLVAGDVPGSRRTPNGDRPGQVAIFDRTANGNAKPLRIIRGPQSGMVNTGLIVAHPGRGLILVGIRSEEKSHPDNYVGVWSVNDNGAVPARWKIGGPNSTLRQVRGIALDVKNKNVIVSDKYLNAVFTFNFPEIF